MKRVVSLVACLIVLSFSTIYAASTVVVSEVKYQVQPTIISAAINNRGQVVGQYKGYAHLLNNGTLVNLGVLSGADLSQTSFFSEASDINGTGQVVGWSCSSDGSKHAFLWQNGVMTDLGTLGGKESAACGINEAGDVVGWSDTVHGRHACLWKNGVITDLGSVGTNSSAFAINDKGQIVGQTKIASDFWFHACIWDNGKMTVLNSSSGDSSAVDINNNGQIIGFSYVDQDYSEHAFLWENGTSVDLGTFGDYAVSWANGINNKGQIVGGCGWMMWTTGSGLLWQNGEVVNLDVALPDGVDIARPNWGKDINDRGQILCSRVILTPVIDLKIDVKPDENPNIVNLKSKGVVVVAVFSTPQFNVSPIDPATALFADSIPSRWTWTDVDDDGYQDLLLYYRTQDLKLNTADVSATLTASTTDGMPVEGTDVVKVVGSRK